jgi:CRISPR-associated protein Cas2
MYVIVVYDVDEERVSKINRLLKSYLIWIQNSVFEGNITDKLLEEMLSRVKKIMRGDDSFIVYKLKTKSLIERQVFGKRIETNII